MEQNNIYKSVFKVTHSGGSGSCFYLKAYDLFVTNYHVTEGFRTVAIHDNERNPYLAKVVLANPAMDIALLAAVGHALRFCLMSYAGIDIATASLCAAVVIGFGSLWLGRGIRCPMTVLYIPALLPMVPGIYAYKTVFALIMFLQSLNNPGQGLEYMQQFFLNATVSFSVIILLAAGATLPIFIFNRRAFSLTRRRRSRE